MDRISIAVAFLPLVIGLVLLALIRRLGHLEWKLWFHGNTSQKIRTDFFSTQFKRLSSGLVGLLVSDGCYLLIYYLLPGIASDVASILVYVDIFAIFLEIGILVQIISFQKNRYSMPSPKTPKSAEGERRNKQ
jgi:hypothetical protein